MQRKNNRASQQSSCVGVFCCTKHNKTHQHMNSAEMPPICYMQPSLNVYSYS